MTQWLNLDERVAMMNAAASSTELQDKIQLGCRCCGWEGDRNLILRAAPAHKGGGWGVIDVRPDLKPYVVIRTQTLSHEIITALRESRKNFEDASKIEAAAQAAFQKNEEDADKDFIAKTAAMAVDLGKAYRKAGKI